mgnify:CR=1 FL=1
MFFKEFYSLQADFGLTYGQTCEKKIEYGFDCCAFKVLNIVALFFILSASYKFLFCTIVTKGSILIFFSRYISFLLLLFIILTFPPNHIFSRDSWIFFSHFQAAFSIFFPHMRRIHIFNSHYC